MSGPSARPVAGGWYDDIRAYLRWIEAAGMRPTTLRLRQHYLAGLAELYAAPSDVSEDDLAAVLAGSGWKPETRKSARASYRSFFAWAHRTGRVTVNPAEHLPAVRIPRALPRPTDDDAIRDALERADDARVRLAVMLAAYAGLRAGEIAALAVEDVRGDVLHITGKGGHERLVPIHPDLAPVLAAAVELRHAEAGPSGRWLFPNGRGGHLTSGHITRLVGRLFGEGHSTHALRHRFATAAYGATRDIRAVQELLGHAKPETTARYAATSNEALRAAVAGVSL